MAETYLSKAGAIVLSGAALLGVAYGIAKYVADFEAAKAEIQSLRGQIVQLQELLTKAQSGWDTARIDRLEKEIAELRAAAAGPAGSNEAQADNTAPKSIADYLQSGSFGGSASDGRSVWPFRASNLKMGENAEFEGEIEWLNLNAIHRIRGSYSDDGLFFKEVEVIKAGNNVIGCEYTLDSLRSTGLSGTYRNCADNAGGGTIEVEWR